MPISHEASIQSTSLQWIIMSLRKGNKPSLSLFMSEIVYAHQTYITLIYWIISQKIYKVSILSKISVIKVLSKKVYTYYFPISLLRVYQSYLTLCNPMDCSLPGSSVHWIFQARILEWVAIPFSGGSSQHRSPGLLPCRQILYHLSHQGSLLFYIFYLKFLWIFFLIIVLLIFLSKHVCLFL